MSVGYLTARENEVELLTQNSIICILLVLTITGISQSFKVLKFS